MQVCTAVAKGDLARARLLAESLVRHQPGCRFVTLVVDDVSEAIGDEPFETVRPEELGVEGLEQLYRGCGPRTLSLALRPWLLEHLLDRRADGAAVWLAPGSRLFASLDELEELAAAHGVVATPGGERVIALSDAAPARELLHDWKRRVLDGLGRLDGDGGSLVLATELERLRDATPADPELAAALRAPPALNGAERLTGPGWAADAGTLAAEPPELNGDGSVRVGAEMLRVFDFAALSGEEAGPLAELAARYGAELERHGHAKLEETPYAHGILARTDPLGQRLRREAAEAAEAGVLRAPLLTEAGAHQFLAWLREPAAQGGSEGVNRFHYGVYRDHPWLRQYYPQLDAGDALRFLDWLRGDGRTEIPIPDDLLPDPVDHRRLASKRHRPNQELIRGVNLAGFLHAEFGLGEAARLLVKGLDARGVPVLPLDATLSGLTRQQTEYASLPAWSHGFPVNLLCVNGNMIKGFVEEAPWLLRHRHNIAMWFWETNRLPDEWVAAFEHLDEIWVASDFMAEMIGAASPVPVRAIPLPVSLPPTEPFDRAEYGIPEDDYLFTFIFDWHSSAARKNPHAVIEAFTSAFEPNSGASLLLKSIQGADFPFEFERVALAASRHPGIHIVDRHLPWREKNRMMAGTDCYVSLHRSEGFGLTLAEAMWLGKPTIATAYGGNLEFMTPENSRLVNYTMTPVGEAPAGATSNTARYPADAVWADPDVDAAAEAMRWAFENRDEAAEMGRRAARDIRKGHAPRVAGEGLERALAPAWNRVAEAEAGPAGRRPLGLEPPPKEGRLEELDELRWLLELEPVRGRPDARGIRKRALEGLGRVLRPYTSARRQIDEQIITAIHAVLDRLDRYEAELNEAKAGPAAERAALFAEVRRINERVENEFGALRRELDRERRGD